MEEMSSNGLHEALVDLRFMLHATDGAAQNKFEPEFVGKTLSSDVKLPTHCYSHRMGYSGERLLSVKWVSGDYGCPVVVGSIVKILYSDRMDLMVLADVDDKICFVSNNAGHRATLLMSKLNEHAHDVELVWYDNIKTLQFKLTHSDRWNYIQIKPVQLTR